LRHHGSHEEPEGVEPAYHGEQVREDFQGFGGADGPASPEKALSSSAAGTPADTNLRPMSTPWE